MLYEQQRKLDGRVDKGVAIADHRKSMLWVQIPVEPPFKNNFTTVFINFSCVFVYVFHALT